MITSVIFIFDSFETETADQFEKAVAELDSEGMKALVLDVRYNGGGLVTAVVQILDDILPEGTVVYTEDKMVTVRLIHQAGILTWSILWRFLSMRTVQVHPRF